MAKQTYGHSRDPKTGRVIVHNETMTKSQAKSLSTIGWTEGPGKSKLKKAARALWG